MGQQQWRQQQRRQQQRSPGSCEGNVFSCLRPTAAQQPGRSATQQAGLTSTVSWNALAWSKAAWPMEPSITKITCCGFTAARGGGQGQPGREG